MKTRRNRPVMSQKYAEEKKAYWSWVKSLKEGFTTARVCGIYYECFTAGGKNWMFEGGYYYQTAGLIDATDLDLDFNGAETVDGIIVATGKSYDTFEDILLASELATRPQLTEYVPGSSFSKK